MCLRIYPAFTLYWTPRCNPLTLLVILCNTLVTNTVCVLLVSVMLSKLQCYCVQWKVWWCKDKDDKGSTGNTTLSCNMRCIACQYSEPKTSQCSITLNTQYSIRNNTQYPEPKSQNPIPPQYLVYQTPNATRDTLRDNTQHQIHQVQTKINLKLNSMPTLGSPVSNSMIQCGP